MSALGKDGGISRAKSSLAAQAQDYMDFKLMVGNLTWKVLRATPFDA
jgi:hypothetical protein